MARPGGRVVVSDPDQESLVIHVSGVRQGVLDRIKALRRDVGYRNGRLASRLPDVFARLGLHDVSVEGFTLVLTDPADAFGLPTWPRTWREEGPFSESELEEWEAAIHGRPKGFLYCVTYLVVAGTKP
ncbi:MAG: hypothetical protein QOK43_2004 [Acidimicrobiaceae bacterium]|nr:hypothetical protein [Acidimicrobiaceae bacterium]